MVKSTIWSVVLFILLYKTKYAFGSEFINCDKSLPIQLYFRFPDPLVITLGGLMKLTASAHMKTEIPKMIKIDHVIKRRFLGRWWKIPCMHGGGSCVEPMPCQEFIEMGFNGTCPIPPGNYEGYHVQLPIPKFPIPRWTWWLTKGLYHIRVKGYTENMERVLFCGEVTQYIQQNITITADADIVL